MTAFSNAVSRWFSDGGRCAVKLLAAGASMDGVDPRVLCRFAATSTTAIRALIDRGVVVRELRASGRGTALHEAAARCADADVFDMLVDVIGIDLDARDRFDSTCVRSAAAFHNVFGLRWLIEAGADVNVASNDGATALHVVTNLDCAVLLLAAGANVCVRDTSGQAALHSNRRAERAVCCARLDRCWCGSGRLR